MVSTHCFRSAARITFIAVLLPCFLHGQQPPPGSLSELSLEELLNLRVETVYGASRYRQEIVRAPAAVTIIPSEEIQAFGHRSLVDSLLGVGGLYATYDRTYQYLGSRGFGPAGDYNARTLFLVNGRRFNDNIYDGAVIDQGFQVDLGLVDRIEVVHGSSSSLFGNSAFFGVVNVITRSGRDIDGAEVAASYGTHNTRQVRATAGGVSKGGLEYLVSATSYESDGNGALRFPEFATGGSDGITRGTDGLSAHNLFASFSLADLTLEAGLVSRTKGIPTGAFGSVFGDPRTRGIDKRGFINLKHDRIVSPELRITVSGGLETYEYDGTYRFHAADYGLPAGPDITIKDLADGRAWVGSVQITKLVAGRHTLVAGIEGQRNFRQDQENRIESPAIINFKKSSKSDFLSPFAQGEFALSQTVTLSAGFRHDEYSTFGGTTNPRIALVVNLAPATFLKLIHGTAFRAPNVYELSYNDGDNTFKANPGLQPEEISSNEFVIERRLGDHGRITASVYHYEINNLIEQVVDPADGLLTFRNLASAESWGGKVALETRPQGGWLARVVASWHNTDDGETHRHIANSPRFLVKGAFIAPLPGDLFLAGLETQYTGSRSTFAGTRVGSAWVTNLTISTRKEWHGMRISISGYNILNDRHSHPAGDEHVVSSVPQDGASFRAALEWRF